MSRADSVLCLVLLTTTPAVAQTPTPAPAPDRATLLRRAATASSAGRKVEAAAALREAASRFQSVRALVQLADIQSESGDGRGAIDSLRKALALAPNAEAVLSALARLSLADHAPVPAIRALEPLARMFPEVAEYRRRLGEALAEAGAYAAAASSLERAEALEPNTTSTLVALGAVLNRLDRCAEAKPYLARSLELDPESIDAAAALAEAEARLGDLDGAQARAEHALGRSPGHAAAMLALGIVHLERHRYADARQVLERATEAAPSSVEAHERLAAAYEALGETAKAESQRARARSLRSEIQARVGPAAP